MNQTELPWLPIPKENLASRNHLRADEDIKAGKQTYFVLLSAIKEYEGYNGRDVYEGLEELADSIEANGLKTPLTLRMDKEGNKYLVRGYRRFKALQIVAQRYADRSEADIFFDEFGSVECFFTDTSVTELDLVLDQFTSNDYRPFTPVENGRNVGILKRNFNLSHEEISRKIGKSRQSVDNWAKVDELPDDTKHAINRGEVSMNEVLHNMREEKKEAKFSKHVELPADNRDEEQSTMGKGLGQTIALQNDRKLDKESQDALEEERLFASNSEEQKLCDRTVSNADWIETQLKVLEGQHPALVADIVQKLGWMIKDVGVVKEALIKLQKN